MVVLRGTTTALCSSFLKRTVCLRILSYCLSKAVHFQHDFQHQKTQFLQLFPPFPPACPPLRFSLSEGIFAHGISHQKPPTLPIHLLFQRATFAATFSHQILRSFPRISSLSGETYGEIFKQNIVFFAKTPYFLVQISACPGVRLGDFRGVNGEKFRAEASP